MKRGMGDTDDLADDLTNMDDGGDLHGWFPFRSFWESMPPGRSISIVVVIMVGSMFCLAMGCKAGLYENVFGIMYLTVCCILVIFAFAMILGHRQNSLKLNFKVPLKI